MGVRRELASALRKVDEELATATPDSPREDLADGIKIQIIQSGIFAAALRIVEFFDPSSTSSAPTPHPTDPLTPSSAPIPLTTADKDDPSFTHALSRTAFNRAWSDKTATHGLEALVSGPLALVAFPSLSPQHLAAVLRTLAPNASFPAPKRRANPTFHEPAVQSGLQKLLLLGARVEGRVFDDAGVRWVGGIQGGLDGLRSQLVGVLQSAGAALVGSLEGLGRGVYFALEGRRGMLEEEGKEKVKGEETSTAGSNVAKEG